MTQTPTATDLKPPSLRTMIVGLLPSVFVNGVLVIIIYQLVKHYTSIADVGALFISAIPAMIVTIISLLRQKHVDVLGAFALITIGISIVLTFFSGDARLYQIRESFLTAFFGIICLVSLCFARPVWFYIIRYFTTGNNAQQEVAFNAAWQYPAFRAYIRRVTVVWGLTYVVEFILRLILVYSVPLAQFLIISPVIFYGITIAVIVWTIRAGGRLRKQGNARQSTEISKQQQAAK